MAVLSTEFQKLHNQILSADKDRRHELQPNLEVVLRRLRLSGHAIPAEIERLNATLLEEAIEAQFDNMPV